MSRTPIKNRKIGFLGSCSTEYCGGIEGYFCVRCRHYVVHCLCGDSGGGCACPDNKFWASEGERAETKARYEATR